MRRTIFIASGCLGLFLMFMPIWFPVLFFNDPVGDGMMVLIGMLVFLGGVVVLSVLFAILAFGKDSRPK